MSDIRNNNLPALAKVIEAAQLGYAPKGLGETAVSVRQSQALTLNVISANPSVVVLQVQNSTQRFAVERQAFQGLSANVKLQNGDKLTLLANNTSTATFALEQASSPAIRYLPQPVLQALSQQWPKVSAADLQKALPGVVNKISLPLSSVNTKNIAAAFIEIAKKSGQPIMTLNLEAKVDAIKQYTFTLNLSTGIPQHPSAKLQLPLNQELLQVLQVKSSVNIKIDATNKAAAIQAIHVGDKPISKASVDKLNAYLRSHESQLKPILSQLLIDDQISLPKLGLVIPANNNNLNALGSNVKQLLSNNVRPEQLHNAKIALTSVNAPTLAKTGTNLQLSLLTQPILVGIEPSKLAAIDALQIGATPKPKPNPNPESVSVDLGKASKLADNTLNKAQNNAGTEKIAAIVKDSLKSKLLSNMLQSNEQSDASSNERNTKLSISKLQTMISGELNQTLAHSAKYSAKLSQSLPDLVKQLKALHVNASPELKILTSNVMQQLHTQSSGEGDNSQIEVDQKLISTEQLKQIFTSSILPNISASPLQSISALNSGAGLINGLVTMLQASLQAKLIAQQPQAMSSTHNPIQGANILASQASTRAGRPQAGISKALQDLHRADPKGNLIGELNKVLSNHSLHKLAAAETSLQGQDSFYYALPNLFSPQHKDIEIAIQREQQQNENEQEKHPQNQWQLNMKLDIGDSGEVLAKVKLVNEQVDLHLYASNEALKDKINHYLPHLNKRLVSLGLQVNQQCYVGKIPDKLYKTEFQVVQAYV